MSKSSFIIKRKTLISMLFAGAAMLGLISYTQLPVELFPDVELPFLIVNISTFQQSDPETVEKEAVIPLEGAVGSLEDIESIESFADPSRGIIYVYYKKGADIKLAYLKLLEKINSAKNSLPANYIVNVIRIDTERMTNRFMDLEVRGEGGVDRLRNIADREIVDKLAGVDGIANVEVSGGREKSVKIDLDEKACEAHGITPARISSLISENSRDNVFVGNVRRGEKEWAVKVSSEYSDIVDLEDLVVKEKGPLLLKNIADISVSTKEVSSISRVNGKSAVTIQLVKDSQVNLIRLSHATRSVVARINSELRDDGIEIVIQNDSAESMERNIDQIIRMAVIGGLLAVVILWFFLRNIRLVLIIAMAVPISIFTAFNLFYAFGISVNSLTLVGMALAVGLLVDNSIVVLENIYRLVSEGRGITESVTDGVREVWRSVFAGTLTTITVFLPFIFSRNFLIEVIGKNIGVSVISTLVISLLAALVLIPMSAHHILKRKGYGHGNSFAVVSRKNRLLEIYNVLLKSSLRFPARVILIAVVAFFVSLLSALALSINVTSEAEAESFNIYVTMPSGSTLESADNTVRKVEDRLEGLEEMKDLVAEIGSEEASLTVKLAEDYYDIAKRDVESIKDEVKKRIGDISPASMSFEQPGASSRYRGGSGRSMAGAMQRMFGIGAPQEKVVLRGNDFEKMKDLAGDIEYYLEALSPVNSASMSISEDNPEIHLRFDQELLSYLGISPRRILAELQSFPEEISTRTVFRASGEEYDIIISKGEDDRKDVDDLRDLRIQDGEGAVHQLGEISGITYSYGKPSISRVNQEKQIEITYSFLSEVNDSKALLQSSRRQVDEIVAGLNIPAGIAAEVVHEENDFSEYIFLFGASFLLIYMILASVFESLSTPVVIMFTIPLAATGSLWLLVFTGTSLLNAYTLTGFLILLGVVVNNGIILIDYSLILRKRGNRYARALMSAGQARVRPILITTITTIVAMIPLAMGKNEETALVGSPFAITIIGGLALSSVFTLIFIPVVFSALRNSLKWMRSRPVWIKVLQAALYAAAFSLVIRNVDSLVWRIIYLLSSVIIIPAAIWFVTGSLRKATSSLIDSDEPLKITIRNLSKIYDQQTRFIREWNKGRNRRRDEADKAVKAAASRNLVWQIPLLVFMVYFVYFYLKSGFWQFALSVPVYLFIISVWKPLGQQARKTGKKDRRPLTLADKSVFWLVPGLNILFFYLSWGNVATVIFVAIAWFSALLIYRASNRLHDREINISRITGRLAGLRKLFYGFIQKVPVIGRKKKPFRALSEVSLEIEKGMFGLLGPNGAGKTTIMRIICGVLEQSYGRIWINGIDTARNREELQGLIGYLPQEFGLYENMTALEFLNYQAILKNITDNDKRERIVNEVLEAVHIEKRKNDRIATFSGGMKQRVGIAQILLHMPRILVVDEPTAGLDPRERIRFRNLLMELSRERIVLFSTHIIEDISSSCKKVAVLNKGRLHYLGKPEEMTATASGKVWQFSLPAEEFEKIREEHMIVHHMRDGENIRVRSLSRTRPAEGAKEIQPTLEDAYLWMLKGEEC